MNEDKLQLIILNKRKNFKFASSQTSNLFIFLLISLGQIFENNNIHRICKQKLMDYSVHCAESLTG